jgi:molybdopterin-binding protein
MSPDSETLNVRQAAQLLHLNEKRVQSLARAGRLPGYRVGRKWLFPRRALARLVGGGDAEAVAANLGAGSTLQLSARNRLRGRITAVVIEGLMAEVRIAIGDQELTAMITRASAERLALRPGDEAYALVKSTEVIVGKEGPGA